MAYDERLADRVRRVLASRDDVVEKSMFGGIAFMVRGHMTVGLVDDDLVVRVAPADGERLLSEPHARPMDFTGRPMRGWIYVEPAGVSTPAALTRWIGRALDHTDAKPAGTAGSTARAAAGRPTTARRTSAAGPRRGRRATRQR